MNDKQPPLTRLVLAADFVSLVAGCGPAGGHEVSAATSTAVAASMPSLRPQPTLSPTKIATIPEASEEAGLDVSRTGGLTFAFGSIWMGDGTELLRVDPASDAIVARIALDSQA